MPCTSHETCGGGPCLGQRCRSADDDLDEDGLTNGEELTVGSNPLNPDSDGDGRSDHDEVGGNADAPTDTDGDGRPDVVESSQFDSDGDGVDDEHDGSDDFAPTPASPPDAGS